MEFLLAKPLTWWIRGDLLTNFLKIKAETRQIIRKCNKRIQFLRKKYRRYFKEETRVWQPTQNVCLTKWAKISNGCRHQSIYHLTAMMKRQNCSSREKLRQLWPRSYKNQGQIMRKIIKNLSSRSRIWSTRKRKCMIRTKFQVMCAVLQPPAKVTLSLTMTILCDFSSKSSYRRNRMKEKWNKSSMQIEPPKDHSVIKQFKKRQQSKILLNRPSISNLQWQMENF